jgi:hypothetical protein
MIIWNYKITVLDADLELVKEFILTKEELFDMQLDRTIKDRLLKPYRDTPHKVFYINEEFIKVGEQ